MIYRAEYASPLGRIHIASDGDALIGLWFEGQKYFPSTLIESSEYTSDRTLDMAHSWLNSYFAGERPCPHELPLSPCGSRFQTAVWRELCRIPYGETVTYGELAARISSSARAVGGAVGHNPISIIIPCHRVVGAGGALTGYAGGIERKSRLLIHEGVLTADKAVNI